MDPDRDPDSAQERRSRRLLSAVHDFLDAIAEADDGVHRVDLEDEGVASALSRLRKAAGAEPERNVRYERVERGNRINRTIPEES